MKSTVSVLSAFVNNRRHQRNLRVLAWLLLLFLILLVGFSSVFQWLMKLEGQSHS